LGLSLWEKRFESLGKEALVSHLFLIGFESLGKLRLNLLELFFNHIIMFFFQNKLASAAAFLASRTEPNFISPCPRFPIHASISLVSK
jgi:hypothetical protein